MTPPPRLPSDSLARRAAMALSFWAPIAGGIPAAVALVALPFLFRWSARVEANLPADYTAAAEKAAAAGDFETALLAQRRLVQVGGGKDEFVFGLAQALDRVGRKQQAEAMVARITTLDEQGHAAARLWLARRLILADRPTADTVDLSEKQLNKVLEGDPHATEAHSLLCRLCLDAGRLSEAERHLAEATLADRFDLKLRLARSLWAVGERRRAADYAQSVEEFFEQRLLRHPEDMATRAYLAEALTLGENYPEAVAVLRAGLDRKQGDLSRLWAALGGAYLAWADALPQRTAVEQRDRTTRLEESLTALALGPKDDPAIDRQSALAYIRLRRLAEAEPPLRRAVQAFPGLLLEWARLHGVLGDHAKGREIAEEARRQFAEALARAPQSEEIRLLAADTEFLLGRYDAALAVIDEGRKTGREAVLERAAARVLVAWSEDVERRTPGSREQMVELIRKALAADPWNTAAVQRLDVLRTRFATGENPAAKQLDALLAREAPLTILAALGARATALGDIDRARTLLERAYAHDALRSDVANNLAWVLAHQEEPDLRRALDVATRAILAATRPPATLLGTRGAIHVKLEQWGEARRDLEAASRELAGKPGFHAQLALVYEHLGKEKLAAEQRRLAEDKP